MTGDGVSGLARVLVQEGQVLAGGRVGGEVLDGRVGGGDPALLVEAVGCGVVQVHLDEVLVEAVGASGPATVAVEELAVLGADGVAGQTGPGLGSALGLEEMHLALLGELGIGLVASEVGKTGPLEDERAHFSKATAGGAADAGLGVERHVAVSNTAGGVEGNAERVGEAGGLVEESVDLGLVVG